jgi:uncharacterized membrane protein (DUF485 family)
MDENMLDRIEADGRYQRLVHERSRLAWTLAIIILVVYFGFTGLIAFDKELLAAPIGTGVTSLGIPLGFGLILFAIALTGIYVRHANSTFDRLTRELLEEVEA